MLLKVSLVVALVLRCALGNGEELNGRAEVRFRLLQDSIIVVPVVIDGQGPFDFVLDTGTETSLIDSSLARQLSLKLAGRLILHSPNGYNNVGQAFLPTVLVGKASAEEVEVLVEHLEGVTSADPNLRGILGQNFLRQFNLMLDYQHQRVSFFPESTETGSPEGTRVPLSYTHGCPTLTARLADGAEIRLMLDSGETAPFFFKTNIPGMRSCNLLTCFGTLQSNSEATQVMRGVLGDISVGDASLHDVPSYFGQSSGVQPKTIDGLFPTSLFRAVYFNNRDGYAILGRASR